MCKDCNQKIMIINTRDFYTQLLTRIPNKLEVCDI